jgi:hypothetical protein
METLAEQASRWDFSFNPELTFHVVVNVLWFMAPIATCALIYNHMDRAARLLAAVRKKHG